MTMSSAAASLVAVLLLAACPRHRGPFPCGGTSVMPRELIGTARIRHGNELTIALPDKRVPVQGAGHPVRGVEGPAQLAFGTGFSGNTQGGLVELRVPLGDIRVLGNGTHELRDTRLEYRDCVRPDFCPHKCVGAVPAGATVEVSEAEGGPMDYPEVVTADFHRKLHIRLHADDVRGKLEINPSYRDTPGTCSPVGYDLDVTVVVGRADFQSTTRTCNAM